MSKITVHIEKEILKIENKRTRMTPLDKEEVLLDNLTALKKYQSTVVCKQKRNNNKILLFQSIDPDTNYLIVYVDNMNIYYMTGDPEQLLKRLIQFQHVTLHVGINKKNITLRVLGCYITPFTMLSLEKGRIEFSKQLFVPCDFPVLPERLSKWKLLRPKYYRKITIPIQEIIKDPELGNLINATIEVNEQAIHYGIAKRKKGVSLSRKFYAPMGRTTRDGFVIFIRRNARGNLTLVKRFQTEYERTFKFAFWENNFVSAMLYHIGRLQSKLSKKDVNLFFEKESSKAEEGAFSVFLLAQNSSKTRNYFIIEEHSADYEKIKNNPNVIRKFSAKYYWLIYRAKRVIATEAPAHLNILRSSNKYLRIKMIEYQFVFLQHGVTYMKCHGPTSAYVKNREAEPDYIFVGSKKERDVVADMLKLPEERIPITGLPIFCTIKYGHITQQSPDYVTIMLTFKPYEERLDNFEQSRYYSAILELYDVIKNYIPEERILIVAHPRIQYLLEKTDLKERMWKDSISHVLEITKLLITDYSSVAYNSFYQGAGVIFYQEDRQEFQEICGELIPADDEYIGYRAFDLAQFDNILSNIMDGPQIRLDKARTEQFKENYHNINSFSDGKNDVRIYETLLSLKLI